MDTGQAERQVAELNARLGLDRSLYFRLDAEGRPLAVMRSDKGETAEVYLQGGQVCSWTDPYGEEYLFRSDAAHRRPGLPIRGGIPVIFPQFGSNGPLPSHGFARNMVWNVSAADITPLREISLRLTLRDNPDTRLAWPYSFEIQMEILLADGIETRLGVTNTGDAPFRFQFALHSYFRLGSIRAAGVRYLQGCKYLDQLDPDECFCQDEELLRIEQETDRIYFDVPDYLMIQDDLNQRIFRIVTRGFRDAVIWNPGAEKAASLADMHEDEFQRMLCVEAARIREPVALAPGDTWKASQRLSATELHA